MITLLAPAIGLLTGPLGRYAMIGLALFGGVIWLRADARRECLLATQKGIIHHASTT